MKQLMLAGLAMLVMSGAALADGDNKAGKSAKVTADEAKAIAIKEVPGTILDADLEKRKGKMFWYIDVKPTDDKFEKRQVRIDANSGAVVAVKDKAKED